MSLYESRSMLCAALTLCTALLAVGCGEQLIDSGRACMPEAPLPWGPVTDTGGAATRILAGETSTVEVVLSECSSGSVTWKDKLCTVTAQGNNLLVESSAVAIPPRFSSTDDCNFITVACDTPGLTAGRWSLSYGGNSAEFDVPYAGDALCVDAP